MSAFTKFLIVLLTVFSLFLCGVVLTYVLTAQNWKEKYDQRDDAVMQAKRTLAQKQEQFDKEMDALQNQYNTLLAESKDIKASLSQSQIDLTDSKRENLALTKRVSDSTGVIEGLQQTAEGLRLSLKNTTDELNDKRGEIAVMSKKLDEISAALDEKIVELDTMVSENKRLLEVKSELEKLVGQDSVGVKPVTEVKSQVTMASSITSNFEGVNLKALVSEVDMANNLATITIGSSDGVQKGMRFHITRGSDFICDMIITNIDPDRSAGVLELVQTNPKIGDNVSSSL